VKNGNCTNHNINQAPENSNQPPQKKNSDAFVGTAENTKKNI
jgi:hypothetical protein